MCAISEVKLRESDVAVYMGYWGGSIKIGEEEYSTNPNDVDVTITRDRMTAILLSFDRFELADLLLRILENAEES